MDLTLVDILRCPADHEESVLVMSADSWLDGRVIKGRLGCPICRREYTLRDGAIDFAGGESRASELPASPLPDEEAAIRLAAQLNLVEDGGFVLLGGAYGRAASAVHRLSNVSTLVLGRDEVPLSPGVTVLRVSGPRLPLGQSSLRGVAVDAIKAGRVDPTEWSRVLAPGGRLVLPAGVGSPGGFVKLAADERELVLAAAPRVITVPLRRVGRT